MKIQKIKFTLRSIAAAGLCWIAPIATTLVAPTTLMAMTCSDVFKVTSDSAAQWQAAKKATMDFLESAKGVEPNRLAQLSGFWPVVDHLSAYAPGSSVQSRTSLFEARYKSVSEAFGHPSAASVHSSAYEGTARQFAAQFLAMIHVDHFYKSVPNFSDKLFQVFHRENIQFNIAGKPRLPIEDRKAMVDIFNSSLKSESIAEAFYKGRFDALLDRVPKEDGSPSAIFARQDAVDVAYGPIVVSSISDDAFKGPPHVFLFAITHELVRQNQIPLGKMTPEDRFFRMFE